MDTSSLSAAFQANRTPILAAAAGGVALLALARKRKTAAPAAGAPAAPAVAGFSSGGQAGSLAGAAYDSTSTDLYGALSPQLAAIGSQLSQLSNPAASPVPVPSPVASSLYNPQRTGNYVRYGNGLIAEVENDGSQLGLTFDQWVPIANTGGSAVQLSAPTPVGSFYDTEHNLAAVKKPAAPGS